MKEIARHQIKFAKTAHYYTLGRLHSHTKYIWFVCHGYGQAADKFIQKFSGLDLDRHFIIAPEGLSRFYWGGFTGDVVASWMTSKDRLDEIADYIQFLAQIRAEFLDVDHPAKWVALGFSQGVSTLMRFINALRPDLAAILLWAGVFPPELDYSSFNAYLNRTGVHYFYGDEDEFIDQKRLEKNLQQISDQNIQCNVHAFSGKHKIEREVLEKFVKKTLS